MKKKWIVFLTFKGICGVDALRVPFTPEQMGGLFKGGGISQRLVYQNINAYVEDYPEEIETYRAILTYLEGAVRTT